MSEPAKSISLEVRRAYAMHSRRWQENRYVYPVLSRRSKGISLGINLNPDKVCNFDCIYCSVDRSEKTARPSWATRDVDLAVLREELSAMLDIVHSGQFYEFDPFDRVPRTLRRVNDIAFSGDGEPTTCPQFDAAVRLAAELRDAAQMPDVKLVLITNATMFHRPAVRETLAFLDEHNGEIWAKLDAGTADYYKLVDRTAVNFSRVLENLRWCCLTRPTVIQSLFMNVHGMPPAASEIDAYAQQLTEIIAAGGRIKLVQIYTVARQTTEAYATALSEKELDTIAARVRAKLRDVPVEVYP